MKNLKTGRQSDQFTLRFPDGMRARVKKIAESNRRTTNAELIFLIEQGIKAVQAGNGNSIARSAVVGQGAA